MALVDVALVVLIDVLTKKVNENNNQILRGYCAFETPSIIMGDALHIEKSRKQTKTFRRYDIGPRPLYVSDHTPPRNGHAMLEFWRRSREKYHLLASHADIILRLATRSYPRGEERVASPRTSAYANLVPRAFSLS